MDINRLTHKSQEALAAAQALADRNNHAEIQPEHLLRALLDQPEGAVYPTLQKLGASPRTLRDGVDAMLDKLPRAYARRETGTPGNIFISPGLRKVLDTAENEAETLKDAYVSTEHVLLALTEESGATGKLLRDA